MTTKELEAFFDRAKEAGKTSIIMAHLEEWPLSDFWFQRLSDPKSDFVWKSDHEHNGKRYAVGLEIAEFSTFIPMITASPEVFAQIKKEIYKIEDENNLPVNP